MYYNLWGIEVQDVAQFLTCNCNVPQNEPCDQNVPTGHMARTFWKYCWTNFKWLPTVMGGYIWGTCWSYNPNAVKMFPPVPDWTHVVGTCQMCPICYYHEIAGLIQPKLSMFSTCNHWFQAPSPPVSPSLMTPWKVSWEIYSLPQCFFKQETKRETTS